MRSVRARDRDFHHLGTTAGADRADLLLLLHFTDVLAIAATSRECNSTVRADYELFLAVLGKLVQAGAA